VKINDDRIGAERFRPWLALHLDTMVKIVFPLGVRH